jgi:hypothetical protein
MLECVMASCHKKGTASSRCGNCGERNIFCCEGCEVELLNDLRAIGRVYIFCETCAKNKKPDKRVAEVKVGALVKKAEEYRQRLIDCQQFEESVILRDLLVLVRAAQ